MASIPPDRLESWKEIADFIGRDQRTAMRWAGEQGMPVHRAPGRKRGRVFALRSEISFWLEAEQSSSDKPQSVVDTIPVILRPKTLAILAAVSVIVFALLAWRGRMAHSAAGLLPPHVVSYVPLTNDGNLKANIHFARNTIYFNEFVGSQQVLASISAKGGSIRRIRTRFPNVKLQDVSLDGGFLLVSQLDGAEYESPLWIAHANSDTLERVGSVTCHAAAWSPNHQQIAFVKGMTVFITGANGAGTAKIADLSGQVQYIHWSPDGRAIRTAVFDASTASWTLWQVDLGETPGRSEPTLHELSVPNSCCARWGWSENGSYFFGGSQKERENLQLWLIPEVSKRAGTVAPQGLALPVGSPGISEFTSGESDANLYVVGMGPKTSESLRFDPTTKQFTVFLPGVSGYFPTLSADERWVVYVDASYRSLWRIRPDGREAVQLTPDEFEDVELPRWSPDGRWVAFLARKLGAPWKIYVVASRGGVPTEVARSDDNQGAPTWSPDGSHLVYANVACQQTHTCAVHLVELSTGKITTIPGSQGLRTARWSPDGTHIAALDPENHRLLLFDFRTQKWKTLAYDATGDDLSWSRDSKAVYFIDPRAEKPVVNRVRIVNGEVQTVAKLDVFNQMAGSFDIWFGLGSDDSLIFRHTLDSSEIYALNWGR